MNQYQHVLYELLDKILETLILTTSTGEISNRLCEASLHISEARGLAAEPEPVVASTTPDCED